MIDAQTFHRIARTFAEDGYEANRDQISFISRDEVITIRLQLRDGQLFVIENEAYTPAARWLALRLGRLNILAERIIQYCATDEHFIVPSGEALLCPEHPNFSGEDVGVPLDDAIGELRALLDWQPAGTTSVVYLTSDGGEGKTTLTNELSVQQARRFKAGESPWLMLPVELGGRPFLRLDEVSTATLVNRLRFSYLYFDSLIEFCRLGFIVLAIDGFEEMFIQDPAGDATSSLGRLLDGLDSSGRVLISARKAFFEFNTLADQTRLYDSLRGKSVAFSRVALRRWTKPQFAAYLTRRGIASPAELHERLSQALGDAEHPLLTRPVLVEKLAEAVTDVSLREGLVGRIQNAPAEYLEGVIGTILTRESTSKWIDRSGDVPGPLLTVDEHLDLLSEYALEMWRAGGRVIRTDTLTLVTELFVESRKKSPSVRHQAIKWAPSHALLVRRDDRFLEFDHEEIFAYFLGRALATEVQRASTDSLLTLLRTSILSPAVAQMASRALTERTPAIKKLLEVCRKEGPTSIAMENSALLLARLISDFEFSPPQAVEHVSFPAGALNDRKLSGLHFKSCAFAPVTVGEWKNVRLEQTTIERLAFTRWSKLSGCLIDGESRVLSIGLPDSDVVLFDPHRVAAWLGRVGMGAAPVQPQQFESDPELGLVEKCVHLFMRATELNEQSIRKRFGTRAPKFFDEVLPRLLEYGVVREIQYQGAGVQNRFELGGPLHRLTEVISRSEGSFERFLAEWGEP